MKDTKCNIFKKHSKKLDSPKGNNVTQFEKETAKLVNIKAATALISGTAAIHLATKLDGIKEGDRVFCQSLTFSACVNPII